MPYDLPPTPDGLDPDDWASAVAEVRAFCGWHIAPEVDETITLDGPFSTVLVLPTLRLVDLVSITNDGTAVADPEWSRSGIVRGCWTHKLRGIVAEITHGYDEWPLDLLAVITDRANLASSTRDPSVQSHTQVAGPFTNTERYGRDSLAEDPRIHRYAIPVGLA